MHDPQNDPPKRQILGRGVSKIVGWELAEYRSDEKPPVIDLITFGVAIMAESYTSNTTHLGRDELHAQELHPI